jgi:hypothetical protein
MPQKRLVRGVTAVRSCFDHARMQRLRTPARREPGGPLPTGCSRAWESRRRACAGTAGTGRGGSGCASRSASGHPPRVNSVLRNGSSKRRSRSASLILPTNASSSSCVARNRCTRSAKDDGASASFSRSKGRSWKRLRKYRGTPTMCSSVFCNHSSCCDGGCAWMAESREASAQAWCAKRLGKFTGR